MTETHTKSTKLDKAFSALAHPTRRRLLYDLHVKTQAPGGSLRISDLEWVDAEKELVALRHCHVPKLVDRGYVEWRRDENAVERGPEFTDVVPLLKYLQDEYDGVSFQYPSSKTTSR